jgi:TonB-dependent starch-binding outer membrane protein SusC
MRKNTLLCLLVLLCHLFTSTLNAQSLIKVTGTVYDDAGLPVPGTSIQIKNGGATVSDANGAFQLNAETGRTLIFTAIGYETKRVVIDGPVINVILGIDKKVLSEVVITGVGTATSKRKLGISVESVTAEKLVTGPAISVDQALIGKIPGAQISSVSGNPGDPVSILLRGVNTVQNGTQPLIMLDGVQVGATDLASLDLSVVERTEIVQGAASASIYGAQGANGVMQLFTKKGKKGAIAVNYTTNYSANSYINSGHVEKARFHSYRTDASNNIIDAAGNILQYNDVGAIEGISYGYGGATRYGILDPRNIANKPYNANLKYYDHFKQVFQTGYSWNNSISLSGATEKSDFMLGVSNNHTVSPVMKNGYVDRSNLTANIGTELFKGFRLRSTTQVIYTKNTTVPALGGAGGYLYGKGGRAGNIEHIFSFLNTSPFFDLTYKMADGNAPAYQTADFLSINAFNPYFVKQYASGLDNKIDIVQTFNANFQVNRFVELDAKYGINYRNENAKWTYLNQTQNANTQYYDSWAFYFANDASGEIVNWDYNTTFQHFMGNAYVRTDFEKDFNINFPIQTTTLISYDYRKNRYREEDVYGLGLPLSPPVNLATASQLFVAPYSTTTKTTGKYDETFITYGYLINQKIDFGDYGGIGGGFRSDWSSAFGSGASPFTFPNVNGYVLPSSFNFWSKIENTIPYLKLRAAYGEAGIQPGPFDRYPTLDQHTIGAEVVYSVPATGQNGGLQVEVSKEFEAGTDLTFNAGKGQWLNAINISFTYWKRKSENVIYTVSAPLSFGATGILNNAIDMSSKGLQFQLNIPVYHSKQFNWDFTTNFGRQTSMIDGIKGGADIILTSFAGNTALVLTGGQKIGQIYGYKALTSVNDVRKNGEKYISEQDAGKYQLVNGMLVDTATRGIQFSADAYPLGDPNPKFNASFISSFGYRDFLSFSFQLDWVYGAHLYNQTKQWMYRDGIHGDFAKPVTVNGVTAAYTAFYQSAYSSSWGSLYGPGNNATKNYFYEDASFLRLRNISIGFDIARVTKIKYFNKLQLLLTGRNLFTVTNYTGFDPEASSGAIGSSFDRGVDNSTIPNTKSYAIGLNVGF